MNRLCPGDVLVLDAADLPAGVRCRDLAPWLSAADVLLVAGPEPVDPALLPFVAHDLMRLVICDDATRRGREERVLIALEEVLGVPSGNALAASVLRSRPEWLAVADLVSVICSGPWDVRWPRDLASGARQTRASVFRRCAALGYARTEHFVTAVRLTAYQCLVRRYGVKPPRAWWFVGVDDHANFRRQARHARLEVPEG